MKMKTKLNINTIYRTKIEELTLSAGVRGESNKNKK